MADAMCRERGAVCHATDERYCIDNGAMIAWAGWRRLDAWREREGRSAWDASAVAAAAAAFPVSAATCTQRFRTDDVDAGAWRELEHTHDAKKRRTCEV